MKNILHFNFTVDQKNNKILVERKFDAPKDLVWAAWTEAEILAQWWAPKPWRAVTKSMDFREGGNWHYYMLGPEGEKHWCILFYDKIVPENSFSGHDAFCDENAVINQTKPYVQWHNHFETQGQSTLVKIELQFKTLKDLESIIEMGFKEGFTMGLENLDAYIAAQFYLRKSKKPDNKTRVSTYVNFPGKTEEAFNFYRGIFKTEFINGIQRFGDLPQEAGQATMIPAVKNMVIHVELPLIGGHVLMGTDAPKEMGFSVQSGNNMHINLETESREETERIFTALSEGGTITQALENMFWGAYFGSCTDRFGINWMVNYQEK